MRGAHILEEFIKQRLGDVTANFSQADEHLVKERLVVAADHVCRHIGEHAVFICDEHVAELIDLRRRKRGNKRIVYLIGVVFSRFVGNGCGFRSRRLGSRFRRFRLV